MTRYISSSMLRVGILFLACGAAQLLLHVVSTASNFFLLLFLPVSLLAAMCGPLPAMVLALLDAVLGVSVGNPRVYFIPVMLLLIFVVNQLTVRGYLPDMRKMARAALALSFFTATLEHLLAYLLLVPEMGLPGLSPLLAGWCSFLPDDVAAWLMQLAVQALNLLAAFLILSWMARRAPSLFPRCGRWKVSSIRIAGHSLLKRLMGLIGGVVLLAALVLFALLHTVNVQQLHRMSTILAQNYVEAVAQIIDPQGLPIILREGGNHTPAYRDLVDKLAGFYDKRDSVVKYFYIYQVKQDEEGNPYIRVIADMENGGAHYGNIYPADSEYGMILLTGREYDEAGQAKVLGPFDSDSHWGRLRSFYTPLLDKEGHTQAYVGVDLDRDVLARRLIALDTEVASLEITAFGLLMSITSFLISHSVLMPLALILGKIRHFRKYGKKLEGSPIQTGDEFELLDDTASRAEDQVVADKKKQADYARLIHGEVYRDALTGVKNKASYNAMVGELSDAIRHGNARFGVLMADMNDLKLLNDRLGHEKGDIALRATCRTLCGIFAHSPVYRVGGDEFVVILQGRDYDDRGALLAKLAPFLRARRWDGDTPWEDVAFSAGLSLYDPAADTCYEDVSNRADKMMYDEKRGIRKEV